MSAVTHASTALRMGDRGSRYVWTRGRAESPTFSSSTPALLARRDLTRMLNGHSSVCLYIDIPTKSVYRDRRLSTHRVSAQTTTSFLSSRHSIINLIQSLYQSRAICTNTYLQ